MRKKADARTSWGAETFDRLYAASDDPWDFAGSDYEKAKYAATLSALPRERFGAAFEIGCSIGVLTAQLAARCDRLLAVDVARAAVAAAQRRCAGLAQVRVARMRIPAAWPAEKFDLIMLSEVLYFLSPADVARTARRALASLREDGVVVLVNWVGPTDSPCTGDEAVALFVAAAPALRPALQQREPHYRLDLLQHMR